MRAVREPVASQHQTASGPLRVNRVILDERQRLYDVRALANQERVYEAKCPDAARNLRNLRRAVGTSVPRADGINRSIGQYSMRS
jgi:hypothetical protein